MQFSVLMSLYHKETPNNLHLCLQSLCKQSTKANEIVLVFDGVLPAELEQVVDDYQSLLPLKIVRLQHNVGLGRALNAGLQACSHDWVFRMDSDDIALFDRFQKQCQFLQDHPEITLLGGQIEEFNTHPEQTHAKRLVPTSHSAIQKFAQSRNPFNHMTVAYRKDAVLQAGSYQHHLGMEDYNLWLRMLADGVQTANLPDTLVYARTGNGMLARRRGLTYIASEWQLYRLKRDLYRKTTLKNQNHCNKIKTFYIHFQAALAALYCFVLRSASRLLPIALLNQIYLRLRQK